MLTHHINTLSNRKVTMVFPPLRNVKYAACKKANNGMKATGTLEYGFNKLPMRWEGFSRI